MPKDVASELPPGIGLPDLRSRPPPRFMTQLSDPPASSPPRPWSQRLSRLRARTRWAVPFAMGVLAAFIAVLLYGAAVPAPRQLTQQDVAKGVSQALASQTPGPIDSEVAYQAVAPSVVLIETQTAGGSSTDGALGSGVVVDQSGDAGHLLPRGRVVPHVLYGLLQ